MGLGNIIITVAVILGIIWFLFPQQFEDYSGKLWEEIKDVRSDDDKNDNVNIDYELTEEGKDYGKIFGHLDCVLDSDCEQAFNIDGLICTDNGDCLMVVNASG